MTCPICKKLERDYEAMLSEYNEACSSAGYLVSRRLAAQKNVDMERARYELEEHRSRCVSASIVSAYLPQQDVPGGSTQVAA
jgi:broad-specificity NMP kinase